ncbi:DUF2382 domain-containing protein [Gloeothece verrucosa]|uniref:PRC-barrel domain protein n=1 Tax=Gloeothece verrucosa (strain PCC 7822) TaxID=497965 RepID=E0U6R0_GLOV7|nr:DUF2382 domain-containing protein [Gloeothece verrucosa]ADN14819.1 Domain of unknown function DUF2382-like protein [Gloeothece verrucosa PCC 7822]
MPLLKIEKYNSNYKNEIFRGNSIESFSVYESKNHEKVGTIYAILVDESGQLRYLVIDAKSWGFDKKVLLPIGRSRIDYSNQRIYALDLTKEQVKLLPEYTDDLVVDYNYEESVRSNYRTDGGQITPYDRTNYSYESEPELYGIREVDYSSINLYGERLLAEKNRQKVGEVKIGKSVITEVARVSVPVEKERAIIEHSRLSESGQTVPEYQANFGEGELYIEIFEETANIRKEAFVSGQVTVKKVVERGLVTAEEYLRREEIKIEGDANPLIEQR